MRGDEGTSRRVVKVAILGTRGVPPNYGGFETMAAELGVRLVKRGYDVTVYCRSVGESASGQVGEELNPRLAHLPTRPLADWNCLHRIVLPTFGAKYFETVSHTFLSALDALRRGFDAIVLCNAANAFVLPLLRAARIPVAINVDGIERRRRKWNFLGRAVYAMGEALSVSFANAVIADAQTIADYYREQYGAPTHVIAYGAEFPAEEDSDVLARLGLAPRDYLLYVSRFEPENNPLEVVLAYEELLDGWPVGRLVGGTAPRTDQPTNRPTDQPARPTDQPARPTDQPPPLVMLGKGLYAPELVAELHRHASGRVLFPGALYGRDYRTLQRNAGVYIQATEVGGTHPALIEAMASGGAVLAHDTPENREVGGDAVGYFQFRPAQTLSGTLSEWLANPLRVDEFRAKARLRAAALYSWERVADQYDELIRDIL